MALRSFAALASLAGGTAAHGRMTLPSSRQGGTLAVAGTSCGYHDDNTTAACECCWYMDKVLIPGEPTICDPDLVTGKVKCPCGTSPDPANKCETCGAGPASHDCDWTWQRPWRAPGSALIDHPCGVQHNNLSADGVDLPPTPLTPWQRGATVDVAMAITANHGGGYAYRLCPATEKPTEACFQRHHLHFADDVTTVRFVDGSADLSIPARRTANGTTPAGSQWTRNPIPGNSEYPPPFPGGNGGKWGFSLIDRVVVPATLPLGAYVLSWRWDCETTPQVWANCGDVEITA